MKLNCGNCIFWDGNYTIPREKNKIGACQRHSPVLAVNLIDKTAGHWDGGDIKEATLFPITSKCDWCGDHQRK